MSKANNIKILDFMLFLLGEVLVQSSSFDSIAWKTPRSSLVRMSPQLQLRDEIVTHGIVTLSSRTAQNSCLYVSEKDQSRPRRNDRSVTFRRVWSWS